MALSREAVRFGVVPGIAQLTDTLARSFQRQQELDARFAEKELELGRKKDAKRISNAQKLVKTKLATTDLSDDDVKSHIAQSRFGFDEAQYGRDVQMLSDTKSLSTDKDEKEYATKELLSRKRGKLVQDANVDTILNSSKGGGYKLSALASDTGDIGLANAAAMLLENDAPPEFQQELQGEINAANNPELLNQLLQQRQAAYDSGDDDTARQLQGRLDQDFYGARDEPLLEKLQTIERDRALLAWSEQDAAARMEGIGVPEITLAESEMLDSIKQDDPHSQLQSDKEYADWKEAGGSPANYITFKNGMSEGRKFINVMLNGIIRTANTRDSSDSAFRSGINPSELLIAENKADVIRNSGLSDNEGDAYSELLTKMDQKRITPAELLDYITMPKARLLASKDIDAQSKYVIGKTRNAYNLEGAMGGERKDFASLKREWQRRQDERTAILQAQQQQAASEAQTQQLLNETTNTAGMAELFGLTGNNPVPMAPRDPLESLFEVQ